MLFSCLDVNGTKDCLPRTHPHFGYFNVSEVFIGRNHHVTSFCFVGNIVVSFITELSKIVGKGWRESRLRNLRGKSSMADIVQRNSGTFLCKVDGMKRLSAVVYAFECECSSSYPPWQKIPPPLCRMELHCFVDDIPVVRAALSSV